MTYAKMEPASAESLPEATTVTDLRAAEARYLRAGRNDASTMFLHDWHNGYFNAAPVELVGALAREVWEMSDLIAQDAARWEELLVALPATFFMTAAERVQFEAMPEVLTLYRAGRPEGLSWTPDETRARWFAGYKRMRSFAAAEYDEIEDSQLWVGCFSKCDVYAFILARGTEPEVIVPQGIGVALVDDFEVEP